MLGEPVDVHKIDSVQNRLVTETEKSDLSPFASTLLQHSGSLRSDGEVRCPTMELLSSENYHDYEVSSFKIWCAEGHIWLNLT